VRPHYYYRPSEYDRALDTHVAIITKSMHELAARCRARFLAVIWPDFMRIEPMLHAHEVHTLPLTDAMPDYASMPGKYAIPVDGHPNALANTRVAEALAEYILRNTPKRGERQ
jgi:hypothetical protein